MNIQDYLDLNKDKYISHKFTFNEFIEYYKDNALSGEDLTVLKYSKNCYILQLHNISKSLIILDNGGCKISDDHQFFINSITEEYNIINPRKQDQSFIKFFYGELKTRYKSLIITLFASYLISHYFLTSGLLLVSVNLTEIFISILGVYFSIMVVFLTVSGFNYSEELYLNGRLSYYWNVDKNLAKLVLYSILYLVFIYFGLSVVGLRGGFDVFFRDLGFGAFTIGFYLLYLNFINLIDFYIDKISYLNMGKYKDKFFENNFRQKQKKKTS